MIELPPSLARHFRDRTGRVDYLAVLQTPDARLFELAQEMPADDRVALFFRVRNYSPGFLDRLAAGAAGVDVDAQRRRLLRILAAAHDSAAVPA